MQYDSIYVYQSYHVMRYICITCSTMLRFRYTIYKCKYLRHIYLFGRCNLNKTIFVYQPFGVLPSPQRRYVLDIYINTMCKITTNYTFMYIQTISPLPPKGRVTFNHCTYVSRSMAPPRVSKGRFLLPFIRYKVGQ